MQRSIESGQLFIPVLIEDVELPEFARTRFYCDPCGVTENVFDEKPSAATEGFSLMKKR